MKTIFLLSFITFLSFTSIECKSKKKETVFADNFPTGKVIQKVNCRFDNMQSYALYLPKKYSPSIALPIIYLFDAHGDGLFPVELFKDAAENFGYILVGSYNSKNGLPWNTTSDVYDTLFSDTHQRLAIDNKRIYTAGFSGGSRVASSIAILKSGVNGVIGCGAGFPNLNQPIKNKFDYFGIAGNADFNLIELKMLDKNLEQSGFRHQLITFNGKHEWPTKKEIYEAIVWLEMNAMKDNLIKKNDTLIQSNLRYLDLELKNIQIKNNVYDEYKMLQKIISFCDGLTDISKYKEQFAIIVKSENFISITKEIEKQEKDEMNQQAFYADAFDTKNLEWWTAQVKLINASIKQEPKSEKTFVLKRLISYLGLAAYMNVNSALKNGEMELTEKYNVIYALVDPENPEYAYVSACLFAKKGNNSKTIASLDKAVSLGFNDIGRMQNDAMLDSVKSTKEYAAIIEKIKTGKK